MDETRKWLNEATFLDRYLIKYYPMYEAVEIANSFIHSSDYKYYILLSDDVDLDPIIFTILRYDVEKYGVDIVSGYGRLREGYNLVSITLRPPNIDKTFYLHGVPYKPKPEEIGRFLTWADYNFQYSEVVKKLLDGYPLVRTYFTGFFATLCHRRVFDVLKLRCLSPDVGFGTQADLAFSIDAEKAGFQQFVDLRCYISHLWFHANEKYPILVGKRKKETELLKAGEVYHGEES